MKKLWALFSYFVALHKAGYTGSTAVSWRDGVPQHTKTESNATPEELPGDDAGLVALLAEAKSEAA
jgi:hypothetical protein